MDMKSSQPWLSLPRRWLRITALSACGLSMAIGTLASASSCDAIPNGQRYPQMPQADNSQSQQAKLAASIDAIEAESGNRIVRVILTIVPSAEAKVRAALRKVGVTEVVRMEGQPLLVTEATPQQLRSLIVIDHVLSLMRDTASPVN